MTIHILERDRSVRDAIAEVFETEGIHVRTYEALEDLNLAGLNGVDLVLMNDRFKGVADERVIEFANRILAQTQLILITNSRNSVAGLFHADAEGSVNYLRKPIKPHMLLDLVTSYLDDYEHSNRRVQRG